jgi:hypothetical protein
LGLRFRRRISIGPGLRINVSKSGLSTSVGTRGAWLTIGHGKARETVGLPGSGLSYTQEQRIDASPGDESGTSFVPDIPDDPSATSGGGWRVLIWLALVALALVALVIWV